MKEDSGSTEDDGSANGLRRPERARMLVICRLKPFADSADSAADWRELRLQDFLRIEASQEVDHHDVNFLSTDGVWSRYTFDHILPPSTQQQDVFACVETIVRGVMQGFNGTVLVYGQTGSGKTYTMDGPHIDTDFIPPQLLGIVPRAVDSFFAEIALADASVEFRIDVSYVEVYKEKVRDLLAPTTSESGGLEVKERGGHVVLDGARTVSIGSREELLGLLREGRRRRAMAQTAANDQSSRSHSLLTLAVERLDTATGRRRDARLVLVDLAGSERAQKTGQRLEESKSINMSLTALGRVVRALGSSRGGGKEKEPAMHVPYRDSVLTFTLREALGGNSRTALIVCCAPEREHAAETLSTLRFGEAATAIQQRISLNAQPGPQELLAELRSENAMLWAETRRLRQRVTELEAPLLAAADPALPNGSLSNEEGGLRRSLVSNPEAITPGPLAAARKRSLLSPRSSISGAAWGVRSSVSPSRRSSQVPALAQQQQHLRAARTKSLSPTMAAAASARAGFGPASPTRKSISGAAAAARPKAPKSPRHKPQTSTRATRPDDDASDAASVGDAMSVASGVSATSTMSAPALVLSFPRGGAQHSPSRIKQPTPLRRPTATSVGLGLGLGVPRTASASSSGSSSSAAAVLRQDLSAVAAASNVHARKALEEGDDAAAQQQEAPQQPCPGDQAEKSFGTSESERKQAIVEPAGAAEAAAAAILPLQYGSVAERADGSSSGGIALLEPPLDVVVTPTICQGGAVSFAFACGRREGTSSPVKETAPEDATSVISESSGDEEQDGEPEEAICRQINAVLARTSQRAQALATQLQSERREAAAALAAKERQIALLMQRLGSSEAVESAGAAALGKSEALAVRPRQLLSSAQALVDDGDKGRERAAAAPVDSKMGRRASCDPSIVKVLRGGGNGAQRRSSVVLL